MLDVVDRFDSKWIPVTECGCHLWTAATNKAGYGKFSTSNGKWNLAHRIAYERVNGKIPDGFLVCHKCDTPSCVNPEHLFIGTYNDNNKDRELKNRGRQQSGEKHGRSKLTANEVVQLRELVASGEMSSYAASKKFGINSKTAHDIVSGKLWKHVA